MSYTIEIEVDDSGGISIDVETADQEAAENSGAQPNPGPTPASAASTAAGSGAGGEDADEGNEIEVGSIAEACALVKQIYANQGQMPSQGQGSMEDQWNQEAAGRPSRSASMGP